MKPVKTEYNIYKNPITDDGTKKSLKGLQAVYMDDNGEYYVKSEAEDHEEEEGFLETIYENGQFYNKTSLTEVRSRINKLI